MQRRRFLASALAGTASLPSASAAPFAREPLRVAVIGHTGRGNFGHGLDTMWRNLPQTRIVAVADPDPAGRATAAGRLGDVPAFADYRDMLRDIRPDIVAVGPRQAGQRVEMGVAAAEAGARGLYVEKPFCRTPADGDTILAACARAGTKVAVAHRNRYHPALATVRTLIDDGLLGTILEYRGRGKEDARGGALDFWVLGSHVSNLATHLGGPPRAVSGMLYQDGRPCAPSDVRGGDEELGLLAGNQLHARFELESGVPYFFDSRQHAGTREAGFGLQILGTRGVLDFRIDVEPLVHFRPGNPFQPAADATAWQPLTTGGLGVPEPIAGLRARVSSHQAAGEDLLEAIANDRPPLCSGEEALLTAEMACAIFASHRQSGQRIAWPLAERGNPLDGWTV